MGQLSRFDFFGALSGLLVCWVIWLIWPDEPFMTVHEMTVDNGMVKVSRTVSGEKAVADWRVTVVNDNRESPSCQTIPGMEVHQGWSPYVPGEAHNRSFTMDVWVGDDGCLARLQPGNHHMFVTWTPRDGRQPVTAKTAFKIP